MDITKYLTKKDIELSNDDINIEKLEKEGFHEHDADNENISETK